MKTLSAKSPLAAGRRAAARQGGAFLGAFVLCFGLAACEILNAPPFTSEPAPKSVSEPAAPPVSEPPSQPAASTDGAETEPLLSAPAEPLVWTQPGVTDEARQRDVADCFAYSRAIVERDRRIDRDIAAGGSSIGTTTRATGLSRELREFGRGREETRFFNSCMASKGYVSQ